MDTERIESLLRKAPPIPPPAGLQSQIQKALPALATPSLPGRESPRRTQLAGWWPRLAWAALLVAAFAAVGLQAHRASELKKSNEELTRAVAALPQLRAEHELYQKLLQNQNRLEQLNNQVAEVERLRSEIAALQTRLQEMAEWQAENARLQAQLEQKLPGSGSDFFGEAKQKADRIKCVNNLKNIGLALRIYATDNEDFYPTDVRQITNELATPRLLICPADESKQNFSAADWSTFRPEMISYQLFLSGDKDGARPNLIMAKCPIHSTICLADGSVQQLSPERLRASEIMVNGRLELGPAPQPARK